MVYDADVGASLCFALKLLFDVDACGALPELSGICFGCALCLMGEMTRQCLLDNVVFEAK